MGPNGAGKSSLCEMLSGIIPSDGGEVRIFGLDMPRDRGRIIEQLGVQLQHTDLYGRYTVLETLELFASFYKQSLPISEVLRAIDLQSQAHTMLRKLSGGQKQRVFLGCCLINNPQLIFLDEPTTGLDPQARRILWDFILRLKREGRSILLTTHFMDEAELLADRIAVMDQGKIVAEGTADALKAKFCPGEIVTLKFDREPDGVLANQLEQLFQFVPIQVQGENAFQARVKSFGSVVANLVEFLAGQGTGIKEMDVRKTTLEDVFLSITGRNIQSV